MDSPKAFQIVEATPRQRESIPEINAAIERLTNRKRSKIEVVGPLAKSKLAWKVAILAEAILHRMVMLARGAADACNSGNILTGFLTARAIAETHVFADGFANRLVALIQAENLSEIDKLVTNRLFASRDSKWILEAPYTQSVNILTFIDKFDEAVPGFRSHYESLSERCHPNGLGHRQFFSEIESDGTVIFSDTKDRDANIDYILTAVFLVCFFETTIKVLDKAVLELSDLQHRINPVVPDMPGSF